MPAPSDPVAQILTHYADAVRAKDVDALMSIYDDDVQVFDMWQSWSLRGKTVWRDMAHEWFTGLGSERVIVTAKAVQANAAENLAFGHAILTYTAQSADGTVLRLLDNRITLAMKRTLGSWLIVHQHTSTPIDHSTLKAILRSAPSA